MSLPELVARGGLVVRYRPSLEPQRLAVDVALSAPDAERFLPRHLMHCVEEINAGGSGGADCPPQAGQATFDIPPDGPGPGYHFELGIAGVSGLYLRHVCAVLAKVPGLAGIRIVGSFDPSVEGAVTERDVARWSGPPQTYLPRFDPPFAVHMARQESGGADGFVRLVLEGGTSRDSLLAFDSMLLTWAGHLMTFGGPAGEPEGRTQLVAPSGRGDQTMSARYTRLRVRRPPAVDLLVNYASRYHANVAPLARLDVGMSE